MRPDDQQITIIPPKFICMPRLFILGSILSRLPLPPGAYKNGYAGARGPLEPLLTALMQIPKRPSAMPPTSDILRVMTRAVERISPATACTADLLLLERCLDVVNKRLQGSESSSTSSQQSSLSAEIARQLSDNLRRKASELLPRFSDAGLMNRCASLLLRVQQVMEPYINALQRVSASPSLNLPRACAKVAAHRVLQGARDDALRASLIVIRSAGSEAPAWAGWRQPSMQWLLDGAWLQKVPDLCSSYNSTADYAEALHRLMVLLTFYWGAGAVWPRCQQRPDNGRDGTDSCCGEPLLLSLTGGGQRERRCTSRLERRGRCENRAAWACPRRRHEDAICISCLAKKQAVLTGSSGRDASTDIYDAVVDEEISRWEGQVYYRLSAVQSRRPPRVAPNWKTSYRLKCSALVAVVPLGSSQEALAPPLRISWAEIVPAGMSRPGQKVGRLPTLSMMPLVPRNFRGSGHSLVKAAAAFALSGSQSGTRSSRSAAGYGSRFA